MTYHILVKHFIAQKKSTILLFIFSSCMIIFFIYYTLFIHPLLLKNQEISSKIFTLQTDLKEQRTILQRWKSHIQDASLDDKQSEKTLSPIQLSHLFKQLAILSKNNTVELLSIEPLASYKNQKGLLTQPIQLTMQGTFYKLVLFLRALCYLPFTMDLGDFSLSTPIDNSLPIKNEIHMRVILNIFSNE